MRIISHLSQYFNLLSRVPLYYIVIGCDNDIECVPSGTSFHCVPLKRDLELAKQVRFYDCWSPHLCVCCNSGYKTFVWLTH